MRAALVLVLVVALGVVAWTAVTGSVPWDRAGPIRNARPPAPRTARTIAELQPDRVIARVEALRGLKLKRRPRFRVLTPAQARRQVAAVEERESGGATSAREDREDVALATLLGLLPPDVDIEELRGRVTSEGTLGYYDGERNEMTIISKGPTLPVGVETTVAHELTHAIEEQHFGIFRRSARIDDEDEALAYSSVLEGSASDVEERYRRRYRIPQPDPNADPAAQRLIRDLPFGQLLLLGFPYAVGAEFVAALRAKKDGQARLAAALTTRIPRSTAQILDPALYLADERPVRSGLRAARAFGAGWTLRQDEPLGAVDVLALLSPTEAESLTAAVPARAVRGGRYQYLRRRAVGDAACRNPCVARDAFVGTFRFADAGQAQSFTRQFGSVLTRRRGGKAVGDGVWRIGGGGAAAGTDGVVATFAYAPTPELARRLVREAPTG
ncbi:hypothetical protein [Patulibacter americanus]|uniref:hypothetical protein n=1 Tax=Patulibacter americanus TaxID=588672 RepID=UPI0003B5C7BB|nr:hypothetical protein [Patulibacter americanus]